MKKIILSVLILAHSFLLMAKCPIVNLYPPTGSFELSNGFVVNLPSKSTQFNVLSIMGLMDYQTSKELASGEGALGTPLMFGHKALGMFMVYQYVDSDMGPFNEIYFLTPMSKKKSRNSLSSLWHLNQLIKKHNKKPEENVYFYYFKVFSGTKTAQLGSKEIWGIDSTLAQIDVQNLSNKRMQDFSLKVEGHEWLSFHGEKTHYFFPSSANFNMLIAGTNPHGGAPLYSPVISCGHFLMGRFNKKNHHLNLGENELGLLFKHLNFKPILLAKGLGLEAVQFVNVRHN